MKASELTKKGKEEKAFLNRKVHMVVNSGTPQEETWDYTVQDIINEFAYLKKNMMSVSLFTQAMALEFYKALPDHQFFKDCDEKLMTSLKMKKEQDEITSMTARLENVLKFKKKGESDGVQIQNNPL
jgi:hypothetical protein